MGVSVEDLTRNNGGLQWWLVNGDNCILSWDKGSILWTFSLNVYIKPDFSYGFGWHQHREDGTLSGQISQEQIAQLHRQQGGLWAREGLHYHLHHWGQKFKKKLSSLLEQEQLLLRGWNFSSHFWLNVQREERTWKRCLSHSEMVVGKLFIRAEIQVSVCWLCWKHTREFKLDDPTLMQNRTPPVLFKEHDGPLLQQELQPGKHVIPSGERVQSVGVLQRVKQVFCLCWRAASFQTVCMEN